MKHITDKMRTHIARNIRLSNQLDGARAAAEFAFNAIEFCLEHDRDADFASILEKSNHGLIAMAIEDGRPQARRFLEQNASFVVDIQVESNTIAETAMPAAVLKPSTPMSEWQGFGW